jgi:hypothetical protein
LYGPGLNALHFLDEPVPYRRVTKPLPSVSARLKLSVCSATDMA